MSIQAMAWAIEQRVVTDATARHVLLVLANYADRDGKDAFPSALRIAEETGLSERSVRYKLDALESAGVIVRGDQRLAAVKIERADRRPVVYDIPGVRGASAAPRSNPVDKASTGCISRQNGVQLTTERGAGAAPNPSLSIKASGKAGVDKAGSTAERRTHPRARHRSPKELQAFLDLQRAELRH